MRRVLISALGLVTAIGAGAFVAPGVSSAATPTPCDGDGVVEVSYVLKPDNPTEVVAVGVDGVAEGCGKKVKVTLSDEGGNKLVTASTRASASETSVEISLPHPVSAALVGKVDLVVSAVG